MKTLADVLVAAAEALDQEESRQLLSSSLPARASSSSSESASSSSVLLEDTRPDDSEPQTVPATPATELDTEAPFGCNLCHDISYTTAVALKTHWRDQHKTDQSDQIDKKFRCALSGCTRTYKNLNGLGYHVTAAMNGTHDGLKRRGRPSVGSESERIVCPVQGCGSKYRQLSGLRYHLVRHNPPVSIEELETLTPELGKRLKGRGDAFSKAATVKDTVGKQRRRL